MKKILFLVLLASSIGSSTFAQVATWRTKTSPEILAKLDKGEKTDMILVFREQADISGAKALKTKSEKARFVYDRLVENAALSQANAVRILKEKNAFANGLYLINAIAVEDADATLVKQLVELEEVKWAGADPWVQFPGPVEASVAAAAERGTVEWGVERIKAPTVWALGFTGQGITIGGADTGYDWTHPALQPHYRGWNNLAGTSNHQYNWHDAIHEYSLLNYDTSGNPVGTNPCGFDAPAPCDDGSHGTHTMGTMVGDDGLGNQIGVAPGATWVGCRNMERGWGKPSSYLECFQWFLAPTDLSGQNADPDKAPHVINNSWYCADIEGCTDLVISDLLRVAIVNLKASGVFVVVSNGNSGWQGCGSTTGPPAYFEESFSVGATQFNDTIAAFSSLGPVMIDSSFRFKPNAVAPGQNIRSSVPNNGYANFSGTSMAGPHMAGLVALVLSARPDLIGQVELIEDIVEGTGIPKFANKDCVDDSGQGYPNNTYGYGLADALAAVNLALDYAPTSLPEVFAPSAKVFPNPVAEEAIFDLNAPAGITAVLEIFAADGQLVFNKNWTTQNRELVPVLMKSRPNGVYFWQIRTEGGVTSGKLVKE